MNEQQRQNQGFTAALTSLSFVGGAAHGFLWGAGLTAAYYLLFKKKRK